MHAWLTTGLDGCNVSVGRCSQSCNACNQRLSIHCAIDTVDYASVSSSLKLELELRARTAVAELQSTAVAKTCGKASTPPKKRQLSFFEIDPLF
jgi:hypothetical protein